MKISAKGRYALAAMIMMAQNYDSGEYITMTRISDNLGISKIYLEQIFSLLKKAGLVVSIKGAQGGYQMVKMPQQVKVLDIFSAIEFSLLENTDATVSEKAPEIEAALHASVFSVLDQAVKDVLQNISLYDLTIEVEKHKANQAFMFFI